MELFFQSETEAAQRAESLRTRGFDVGTTAYEGGHMLAISGSPELMETLSREVIAERRSKPPRVLTGEDSLTGRGVRFSCVEGGTPLLEPANRFAE